MQIGWCLGWVRVLYFNVRIELGEREQVWEVAEPGLFGVFQILAIQELIESEGELVIQFEIELVVVLVGVCTLTGYAGAQQE